MRGGLLGQVNATFGATVDFKLFNSEESPRVLYETWWSAYGTVSKPSLPTGGPWIYPYRGTRRIEGLPGLRLCMPPSSTGTRWPTR